MAPRGVGTMAAMLIAGRLTNRIDPRMIMAFGIVLLACSFCVTGHGRRPSEHWSIDHRAGRWHRLRLHPAERGRLRDAGRRCAPREPR